MARRWAHLWSGLALALCGLAVIAAPAAGHAVLEDSTPKRGAQLDTAPPHVEFAFSEPVETSFGAVRVFDSGGAEVQEGEPFRPEDDARRIAVELPIDLPDGAYTATYSVISADSHPISGGIVFTVGEAGTGPALSVTELIGDAGAGPVTQVAFWLVRLAGYLAIALAVGLILFLVACWRPAQADGRRDAGGRPAVTQEAGTAMRSRSRKLLSAAILVGLVATVLSIPLQAATAGGSGFFASLGADQARAVLETRFGLAGLLRFLAWLTLIPLAFLLTRPRGLPTRLAIAGSGPALVLLVAPALGGHAASQGPSEVLIPANALHVAAMAVWIGGIFALVLALPRATQALADPADRAELLAAVLLRFSGIALLSVVVLTLTGVVQTVLELESLQSLWETAFGRTVLLKTLALLVMVAFGAAFRRRLIPALARLVADRRPLGDLGRALRRNLRWELAVGVVAIGLAAALVSYPPNPAAGEGPVTGLVVASPLTVEYIVDPAEPGSNEMHIYIFAEDDGRPFPLEEAALALTLPDAGIGPVAVDLTQAGPGHYTTPNAIFAQEGDWRADLTLRWSDFDQIETEIEIPIR